MKDIEFLIDQILDEVFTYIGRNNIAIRSPRTPFHTISYVYNRDYFFCDEKDKRQHLTVHGNGDHSNFEFNNKFYRQLGLLSNQRHDDAHLEHLKMKVLFQTKHNELVVKKTQKYFIVGRPGKITNGHGEIQEDNLFFVDYFTDSKEIVDFLIKSEYDELQNKLNKTNKELVKLQTERDTLTDTLSSWDKNSSPT